MPTFRTRIKDLLSRVIHPRKKHPWLKAFGALLLFAVLYVFSSIGGLRTFVPHYPALTGFPFGSKNYLVVFQNNHELRPAGGFVSAFAIAKFRSGFLTGFETEDVYGAIANHPYLEPPYPMKQLLTDEAYQGYTFRDGNYDADYPKSAEELTRLLHITRPELRIDGVIAVNYSFMEDLLGALGPIEVKGRTFTKDSLFSLLEYEVNNVDRHNVEALQNRKNILKEFAQKLIKKTIFSPLKLRRVSDAVVHSLATKEIQLYFKDPSLEKTAVSNSWSGVWPDTMKGDFLGVVEANLGGMKSDRYIQRNVTYHVTRQDNAETGEEDLIAELSIIIRHYGVENIPLNGEYTGFFRTYVPRGAKLLDAASDNPKSLWTNDDGLYTILGNVVRLSPGKSTTLYYKYKLPATIDQKDAYQLYIPKQSGTDQDYYTIVFEAPAGAGIESTDFTPKENVGMYQQELISDASLSLKILPDKLPPNVIYQAVEGLNKITLVFNENVSNQSSEDPLHYEIRDLNAKHPETTDDVTIDHIEHQGKGVALYTKNMTLQPGEHYQLTLKNIGDTSGNMIDPNPKTVTVVQKK